MTKFSIITLLVAASLSGCATIDPNITVPDADKQAYSQFELPVKSDGKNAVVYFTTALPKPNMRPHAIKITVPRFRSVIVKSGEYAVTTVEPGQARIELTRSCTRRNTTPMPNKNDIISPDDSGYIPASVSRTRTFEAGKTYIMRIWGECTLGYNMHGNVNTLNDDPNASYYMFKNKRVDFPSPR